MQLSVVLVMIEPIPVLGVFTVEHPTGRRRVLGIDSCRPPVHVAIQVPVTHCMAHISLEDKAKKWMVPHEWMIAEELQIVTETPCSSKTMILSCCRSKTQIMIVVPALLPRISCKWSKHVTIIAVIFSLWGAYSTRGLVVWTLKVEVIRAHCIRINQHRICPPSSSTNSHANYLGTSGVLHPFSTKTCPVIADQAQKLMLAYRGINHSTRLCALRECAIFVVPEHFSVRKVGCDDEICPAIIIHVLRRQSKQRRTKSKWWL